MRVGDKIFIWQEIDVLRHQYTKNYYAGILHARHNNHNTLRKISIPGFIKVAKSRLHEVFDAKSSKGASRRLNKILRYHKW